MADAWWKDKILFVTKGQLQIGIDGMDLSSVHPRSLCVGWGTRGCSFPQWLPAFPSPLSFCLWLPLTSFLALSFGNFLMSVQSREMVGIFLTLVGVTGSLSLETQLCGLLIPTISSNETFHLHLLCLVMGITPGCAILSICIKLIMKFYWHYILNIS